MRLESAVLHRVEMPLKFLFKTSFGETTKKRFLLLELRSGGLTGLGECVAEEDPFYSWETIETAKHVLSRHLLPLVLGRDLESPKELPPLVARVRGHRMAKGALDAAVWDLFAKSEGVSLSSYLGGVRESVEVGVSLGMAPSAAAAVENVAKHVAQGYRRIKLKIEPGCDVERLEAVREAFPSIVLTVDANAAYRDEHFAHVASMDRFALDYMEQPLHYEDLDRHAALAKTLKTPICLDESIRSAADTRLALALGSCRVVNVKLGRVGGYSEALAIQDAVQAAGVPLWCGGMLEAGVGRAHNVALASLPSFTKPGDTSSSSRYFVDDIVEPALEATDGLMPVPKGPGIGVELRRDVLSRFTSEREEVSSHG